MRLWLYSAKVMFLRHSAKFACNFLTFAPPPGRVFWKNTVNLIFCAEDEVCVKLFLIISLSVRKINKV